MERVRWMMPFLGVSALVTSVGCAGDSGSVGQHGFASAGTTDGAADTGADADGSDSGGNDGGDTGGDDGESSGDGGEPRFDVGVGDSGGGGDDGATQMPCEKVDFLFVVDASPSMLGNRQNMIANFPAFISGIQGSLDSVDSFHVGVLNHGPYEHNIEGCREMGDLVVKSGLSPACTPFTSGRNYLDETQGDLAAKFECIADVRSGGLTETLGDAAVAAIDRNAGPGDCNEGFLRDDSLLVITMLTDEPGSDALTGQEWFDRIVAARGGVETNIVVLALFSDGSLIPSGGFPFPLPSEECSESPSAAASEFVDFVGRFTHGYSAHICEPDYGPFFQAAVSNIKTACDDYVPPAG